MELDQKTVSVVRIAEDGGVYRDIVLDGVLSPAEEDDVISKGSVAYEGCFGQLCHDEFAGVSISVRKQRSSGLADMSVAALLEALAISRDRPPV